MENYRFWNDDFSLFVGRRVILNKARPGDAFGVIMDYKEDENLWLVGITEGLLDHNLKAAVWCKKEDVCVVGFFSENDMRMAHLLAVPLEEYLAVLGDKG